MKNGTKITLGSISGFDENGKLSRYQIRNMIFRDNGTDLGGFDITIYDSRTFSFETIFHSFEHLEYIGFINVNKLLK